MPIYEIDVRQMRSQSGTVRILAASPEHAVAVVTAERHDGKLQTTDPRIRWNETEYVDWSLQIDPDSVREVDGDE